RDAPGWPRAMRARVGYRCRGTTTGCSVRVRSVRGRADSAACSETERSLRARRRRRRSRTAGSGPWLLDDGQFLVQVGRDVAHGACNVLILLPDWCDVVQRTLGRFVALKP